MDANTPRAVTVKEMYDDAEESGPPVDEVLGRSLGPRGPEMLFDMAGELGVCAESVVLDVGSRDGRHLFELARRFGCRAVGVEPVAANLHRGLRLWAEVRASEPEVAARVAMVQGVAEGLPFPDGAFDLVWVRDVLIHVPDLAWALGQCRRVLAPGGSVLVFQMFATPWLEPSEAARLWPSVAAVEANTDPDHFEASVAAAGLQVVRREDLRSEWREFQEESGPGTTSRQLLWIARLLRDPDRLREELGPLAYDVELANCLWGVYQMIGKLSPRVYVLAAADAKEDHT
jgi:SAM-dependent methyltransferase